MGLWSLSPTITTAPICVLASATLPGPQDNEEASPAILAAGTPGPQRGQQGLG